MDERKPPYTVRYNHKGRTWIIHLPWADGWDDAEARLKSIGFNGKVIGSNAQRMPLPVNALTLPFVHLFMNAVCFWRNLWRRK